MKEYIVYVLAEYPDHASIMYRQSKNIWSPMEHQAEKYTVKGGHRILNKLADMHAKELLLHVGLSADNAERVTIGTTIPGRLMG